MVLKSSANDQRTFTMSSIPTMNFALTEPMRALVDDGLASGAATAGRQADPVERMAVARGDIG